MATGKPTSCGPVPASKVVIKSNATRPMVTGPKTQTTLTSTSRRTAPKSTTSAVQSRKSSLLSTSSSSTASAAVGTSASQRGLKLRPTNPSVLPVLCVYSDQNQLVRKEQFRIPPPTATTTSQRPQNRLRNNNENVNVVTSRSSVASSSSGSQIPVATAGAQTGAISRAVHLKSTISSTARAGSNNNNSSQQHINNSSNLNGAKRSRMTVPRSVTSKVPQPAPSNKGIVEKVNRRRNEKSVPPIQSRKAEMTSGVSSSSVEPNQNKPTANPQLPGLSGVRPTTSSSSSIADGPFRGSVAAQLASRAESNVLHRPTVGSLPSTSSTSPNNKKVTGTRNPTKPPRISLVNSTTTTSAFESPPAAVAFHPAVRVALVDNPDLKLQSQGSTVANDDPELHGAQTAGATGLDDPSSVCDKDTNYVVFDYPDSISALLNEYDSEPDPDYYSQVVVNQGVVEKEPKYHHNNIMGTYPDVGYSSEKTPDDGSSADIAHQQHLKEDDLLDDFFKFVSNENIRKVTVHKTVQGLGLSVAGGVAPSTPATSGFSSPPTLDSALVTCSWPGLIRIKKIFPHGAAWQTGQLAVGDVLLAANGQPLTGCTNYEALEVLRCSPRETQLLVCRIPSEIAEKMGIHPPETPTASYSSHSNNWLSPVLTLSTLGEFEISMTKVNGSLGFTLRKEDESILGHYVRSLVKEPAISDGRIRPGDKIISVNGVDMSAMSHAEAVAFLRRCPDSVTIRLFRDSAVTPLSPLSPTEPELGLNRPRPLLRQEAQDLLHDLAVRKQGGSRGGSPAPALSGSPCSPRRRRLTKTPSPDLATVVKDRFGSSSSLKDSLCSIAANSTSSPPMSPLPEMDMERDAVAHGLDQTDSNSASFHTPGSARISRPDFLDLSNSLVKKQRFMFTPPNDHPPSGFEERQAGDGQPEPPVVDQVELEISEYLTPNRMADSIRDDCSRKSFSGSFCIREDSIVDHPTMGSVLEETMDDEFVSFQSSSTMERYAPQGLSDHDLSNRFPLCDNSGANRGKDGLVKWKGIVLTPDEEYAEEAHLGLIQTIELNKGWNSRLGFSVGLDNDGQLVISAIYDESVAAKDGRLKVGDHVLRVNGEKLEGCSKDYVIDILRKTRGPVAITVRKIA